MAGEPHISRVQKSNGTVSLHEKIGPSDQNAHSFTSSLTSVLPYAEVEIHVKFLGGGNLPAFRGVSLRGGLGYHLRKTVCHVHSNNCDECIVRPTCVYSYIFEGVPPEDRTIMRLYPYVPQPFVILTELKGPTHIQEDDHWKFGLRLFGRAIEHFPYIAYSLMELGEQGFGKERIKFNIEQIVQTGEAGAVFQSGNNRLRGLRRQYPSFDRDNLKRGMVTIKFITPVRLRIGGKDARQITFSDIVRSSIRRLSILTHFYGVPLADVLDTSELVERSSEIGKEQDQTEWFGFQRYSNRQGRKVPLGGLVGKISFSGDLNRFLPVLMLSQISHIGKATSFGFGRIVVS